MGVLKFILSKEGIYAIIAVLLFGAGVTALYYLKYRPIRNETISLRAENKELREQLKTQKTITDAVWHNYYELAKLPRYEIDQHLDRIKVKRNSSLDFLPSAEMNGILDSVAQLEQGDSVVIQLPDTLITKKRTWLGRQFKKIGNWFN